VVSGTLSGLEAGEVLGVCVDQGAGSGGPDPDAGSGGAGGGASGVTLGSDPVLIAGGGGGGGDGGRYGADQGGGSAGLPGGVPGEDAIAQPGALGGGGGSQTQGGAGGSGDSSPACGPYCGAGKPGTGFSAGAPGTGGYGGQIVTITGGGGGGGGGGYYGGGGGGSGATPGINTGHSGGAGGGGGSDFCGASLPTVTLTGCAATGDNSSSTTASVLFTYPVAPPAVSIALPANGSSYVQGQAVSSSFSCDDGAGGSWLVSCVDQSGRPSGSPLDTSTLGSHTFTVTATTRDGLTGTSSVTYQVLRSGGGGGVNPTAVTLAALHATTLKFHIGKSLVHFSRSVPTGTTISFSLGGAARVTLTFNQLLPGKRSGRRCIAPKPKLKQAPSCTQRRNAGSLSFNAAAGSHRLFFDGRLSRRKTLLPGSYELSVTATANGRSSKTQKLQLTLLPPLKP
jgi:hypothetical protein